MIFIFPLTSFSELVKTSESPKNNLNNYQKNEAFLFQKNDEFIIKPKHVGKYKCRCFIWSKNGQYKSVHKRINPNRTTTYFIEDLENGATIANTNRWIENEHKLNLKDAPSSENKKECFNTQSIFKITKVANDQALATMIDSKGQDISIWIQIRDLEKAKSNDPNYQKKIRPEPIISNDCNLISSLTR